MNLPALRAVSRLWYPFDGSRKTCFKRGATTDAPRPPRRPPNRSDDLSPAVISFRSLLPLGCGLLLAVSGARAQQLPPSPSFTPPPPPPGTPPTLPLNLPGVPSNPMNATGDDLVKVQFSNSPIGDVLYDYGLLTGKRVLTDNTVNTTSTINFDIAKSVPRSEAIAIIETVLNLNGYSIAPGEANVIKVLGPGKNPRAVGIPIFSDPNDLPRGEKIVSFLLRLRYLDPIETAGVLQQYIPPGNTVNFTALEKAGAIIVTDNATSVRRLVDLVASLDQPFAPVIEKWIRLERADASKAIEFLNSVLDSKGSASSGSSAPGGNPGSATTNLPNGRRPIRRTDNPAAPPDQPTFQPVSNGNGPITLSGDSIIQGRITLTADVRTNRVNVVTSAANMIIVEHLLEEFDADTPFATPVPRPLKFVNATDVLPILVQALSEPGSDQNGTSNTGTSSTGTTGNRSTTGSSNTGLNNTGNTGSSNFGSGSSSSSGSSSVGSSELNTQAVDTKPSIAVVGSTKIIADPRVNTILVLGNRESRDKVFAVLDRLDVRAPQVIIRTVIGELSLGKNSELGFNYLLRTKRASLLSNFNSGQLPGVSTTTPDTSGLAGTGGVTSTTTASALNSFSTLATGLGSSFSGVGGIIAIGKSFDVILSALESTSRFKTISRPMIFTSNNKEAIIASGQEIAVPTETISSLTTNAGSTGLTSNVEYKDVVLQLEVVPLINSENEVTLDIVQRIDNVVAGSNTTVANNQVPTIATRKLKSTVSAPNNSTIVLGGLITQDSSKSDNNIPYLSRIPVIGALFRSRTLSGDRSELIILMHPEVVNTEDLLVKARENEARRTYLGNGLEDQLLPAEVRKATAVTTTTTTTVPTDTKDGTRKKATVKHTTTHTTVTRKKEPDLDHF